MATFGLLPRWWFFRTGMGSVVVANAFHGDGHSSGNLF